MHTYIHDMHYIHYIPYIHYIQYIHAYMHAYMHTCILTYIHYVTFIHSYIHTCIYLHTDFVCMRNIEKQQTPDIEEVKAKESRLGGVKFFS